jgi:cytochrome c biogenesis protein
MGRQTPVNAIYKFFRSTRLAVVLILVIILLAGLSTLIPQGKTVEEYRTMYSPLVFGLVTMSGLGKYTGSIPFFWVPIILFIANLGTCTISRLVTRAKNKAVRHFGPDLIHIALLLLAVGALITATVRREQDFTMAPGESVSLPDGYSMTLTDFQFLQYPDGRPKAWISTVDIGKDGAALRKGVKIEVNHPLSIGALKVYQTNYGTDVSVDFIDSSGAVSTMHRGEGFSTAGGELVLSSAQRMGQDGSNWVALFQEYQGPSAKGMSTLAVGDSIGGYKASSIKAHEFTGLRAATDPGFIPVLIALMIGAVGLTMTSIHKSKGDI